MISVMLASVLSSLDQDIVSTAMPTIAKKLGSPELYGWVFTAYMITSTISLIVFSRLSDFYGTKSIFLLGLYLFLVGSVLCATAFSMGSLVVFRLIQGIGGGILLILPMIIIADLFPKDEWGKWQGILFAAFGFGNLMGPVLGGFLTQFVGWRSIFWINVPLVIAAIFLATRHKGQFGPIVYKDARPDIRAIALFTLSLGILLVSVDQLVQRFWLAILLLMVGVAVGAGFVRQETGKEKPLIPLDIFKNKTVFLLYFVSFLIAFSMIGAAAYVPLYIQDIKGYSPQMSGLIMLPIIVVAALSSFVAGSLLGKVKNPKWLLLGILFMLMGPLALICTVTMDSPIWLVILYGCTLGVGIGGSLPVTLVLVQLHLRSDHLAIGSSIQTFVRTFGASAGLAMAGAIIGAFARDDLMEALRFIFIVETIAAAIAIAVTGLFLRLDSQVVEGRMTEKVSQ